MRQDEAAERHAGRAAIASLAFAKLGEMVVAGVATRSATTVGSTIVTCVATISALRSLVTPPNTAKEVEYS